MSHALSDDVLRAARRKDAFLLALSDALRPLSDPAAVQATACRVLGEELDANRVLFCEIRGPLALPGPNYLNGLPAIEKPLRLEPFGALSRTLLESGRPRVFDDVAADPRVPPAERAAFAAAGVRATIAVGLVKQGRWVATLGAHAADPRAWSESDVDLLRETAERTWDAVERARAEEALREEQERTRRELDALARIHRVAALFLREGDPDAVLEEMLEAAIACTGADAGTLQRLDREDGALRLVAWRGVPDDWVEFWRTTSAGHGGCGTSLVRGERVVIEDVEESPLFRGTPDLEVQRRAGVRAVQSTPLVGRSGALLGILSTHWRRPGAPDARALQYVDLLARQAADILERARTVEALRAANERLLETDRRRTDFLAVLSHELRNPLAPIRNSLYILEHAAPGGDQARRALEVVGRQTDQLARLVDDLLEATRLASDKIRLQKETLDLNALVARAIEDHRALFDRAHLRLLVAAAPAPVPVHGDPNRLAQAVGNLLQNAAKFTPRGGSVEVRVEADRASELARVTVLDDGAGLAPEVAARLFEPFMQGDETLHRSKGGLGLGLAIVKRLAELHGGSVSAHSDGPGRGSRFSIQLPLTRGVEGPRGAGAAPPAAGDRRRVLVIEDNVDGAESLRQLLEMEGHEVVVAFDGAEGVARARLHRPDVVLCDIGLPGLDGYAVARALRAEKALAGTRLVALSGYALPEDVKRALDAGFHHHLPKPPDLERLQRALASP